STPIAEADCFACLLWGNVRDVQHPSCSTYIHPYSCDNICHMCSIGLYRYLGTGTPNTQKRFNTGEDAWMTQSYIQTCWIRSINKSQTSTSFGSKGMSRKVDISEIMSQCLNGSWAHC